MVATPFLVSGIERLIGLILAVAILTVAAPSAQPGAAIDVLLLAEMGFSDDHLRSFSAGSAVIRSLETPVREELAHVGAVYLNAPAEHVVERFRDIERFERGPGVPHIGRFSQPPRLEDLQRLTLPPADVAALSTCRPGDCALKLSAPAMRRFRTDVDWTSADATRQVNALVHEMLLELVRDYQARGNAALGTYDDGDRPLPVAEQFRGLLRSRTPLPSPVPGLLEYLDDYPHGRPDAADDFFYWTVVDFGLKPTIRVNHVVIHPLPMEPRPGVAYAIAIKQLYASHYLNTTLELRFLVDDDRRSDGGGASLISIVRSRNDGMTGFKGWFLRPIITRRSRAGVRDYLEHFKRQVDRPASAPF